MKDATAFAGSLGIRLPVFQASVGVESLVFTQFHVASVVCSPGQYAFRQPPGQLYNLRTDPGETNNLHTEHPGLPARVEYDLTPFGTGLAGILAQLRELNAAVEKKTPPATSA